LLLGDWGNNIKVTTGAGYYLVKANLNDATYSNTKTDWGLVGSATGSWDVDQDMTYDPLADKWTITLNLVAGAIKFRANGAWDINMGDDKADLKLEYGGPDIVVSEAGNYTVTLNLSEAIYRYTLVKN